jgi:raffinose/stachyose/melibiose transport system permease protein
MTSGSSRAAGQSTLPALPGGLSSRPHRWRIGRITGRTAIWVCCLLWACVAVWPLVAMARLGFESTAGIFIHPLGIGGGWTLSSYRSAWDGPPAAPGIARLALNSVEAVVPTLVLSIAGGFGCAYGLVRVGRRLARRVLPCIVVAAIVPLALIIIPLYEGMNLLGLLSDPPATGIVYGALALPTAILIFYGGLVDFPNELLEAAALDGNSEVGTLWRVVVPLSGGIIIAVTVIILVFAWGEAQIGIILLQSPQSKTLAVGLLGFEGEYVSNYAAIYAGLAMSTVPIALIYLAVNGKVRRGISLAGMSR